MTSIPSALQYKSKAYARQDIEWLTRDNDWLNPINMQIIQGVIKRNEYKVTLDGIEYHITYRPKGRDCVLLKRTDGGFAPGGYIEIPRILHFDFERDGS